MKKLLWLSGISILLFAGSQLLAGGYAKALQTDPKARKALLAKGKTLYVKHQCQSCHGEKGVLQGDLRAAFTKYNDEELKQYIKNPRSYSNTTMPVYGELIPETDYPALLEYVKFLGESAFKK